MSFSNVAALNDALDPRRVALPLDISSIAKKADGKPKPVRTRISLETGQLAGVFKDPTHGLLHTMTFARQAGAHAVMPCSYLLETPAMKANPLNIQFMSPGELGQLESETGIKLGVPSNHCVLWSMTSVRMPNGLRLVRKFVPEAVRDKGVDFVAGWCEDYTIALLESSAARNMRLMAAFWGLFCPDPVSHSGYPWTFDNDDLRLEGLDAFVKQTEKVRQRARDLKAVIGHEVHDNSAATCGDEFGQILVATDYDPCVGVWGDPSHSDEGEDWRTRNAHAAIADRNVGGHIKNFSEWPGIPKRKSEERWNKRGKRFCNHADGVVPLGEYHRDHVSRGAGHRFAYLSGDQDPNYLYIHAASEAEDWAEVLVTDEEFEAAINPPGGNRNSELHIEERGASAHGIQWCRQNLMLTFATGSFSDTMGT